jgi:hypothetical protein
MIAARVAVDFRSASELRQENDKRVVDSSTLREILNKR